MVQQTSDHILDIHDRHPEIFLEWNKMTCLARYANKIYLDQWSSPPPRNFDFIATNNLKEKIPSLDFFNVLCRNAT